MKKYKIGDISKMLNIPVQTIRFYEEHGIVQPQKDPETGYRYYDSWDLNNLMDCLHLRGLDFSLSQTEKMINSEDLDTICRNYMIQENELIQKIEAYKIKLDVLSRERQKIQQFRQNQGKMRLRKNPALIYHRFRNNDTIKSVNGYTLDNGIMDEMHGWIRLIPDVTPTFMMQYHSHLNPEEESPDFWWGWSLPLEDAVKRGIEALSPNEYLPPVNSIYTIFSSTVRGGFRRSFKEQVLDPILSNGYELNGNPIGRLITRTHEQGEHRIYLESWVPVING